MATGSIRVYRNDEYIGTFGANYADCKEDFERVSLYNITWGYIRGYFTHFKQGDILRLDVILKRNKKAKRVTHTEQFYIKQNMTPDYLKNRDEVEKHARVVWLNGKGLDSYRYYASGIEYVVGLGGVTVGDIVRYKNMLWMVKDTVDNSMLSIDCIGGVEFTAHVLPNMVMKTL